VSIVDLDEGFGNVLVEAKTCSCPVVSMDCPSGRREILMDGEYGHLTPVGDVSSMREAIIKCLSGDTRKPPKLESKLKTLIENVIPYVSSIWHLSS
jgi:glycosyltransferase involved in cell wall biosynthesis